MTDPDPKSAVRELVFEYLERDGEDPAGVLAELARRRPDLEHALRARVELLERSGLARSGAPHEMPARLGPFDVLERLGAGGMGVVYRARDEALGRDVALKVVRTGELFFDGTRERFEREVRIVAGLSHPGIVPVYSVGEEGGVPYFAMELIEGCTLATALQQLLAEGKRASELRGADLARVVHARASAGGERAAGAALFEGSWSEVSLRIVHAAAGALDYAHRRGVLHRDVKPSNLFVTPEGRVLVFDFGLSSAEGAERLTRTGAAMGSLAYMPPEQHRGDWETLDARADVYALGATLYELLTLSMPFPDTGESALRAAVLAGELRAPRRVNERVSWEVETVCLTAMDVDPRRRYASAGELAADAGRVLDGLPIRARRVGPVRRLARWVERHPARAAVAGLSTLLLVGGPATIAVLERRTRGIEAAKNVEIEAKNRDLLAALTQREAALEQKDAALEEARTQRDLARGQQALALENLREGVGAVRALLVRVGNEQLVNVPGVEALRVGLLADATRFLESFLARHSDAPELVVEVASAYRAAGMLQGHLQRYAEGNASFERALELLESLGQDALADRGLQFDLAMDFLRAAQMQRVGQHFELAEASAFASAAEFERLLQKRPTPSVRRGMANVLRELGELYAVVGRQDEAQAFLEDAREQLEELHAEDPSDAQVEPVLAATLRRLASQALDRESAGTQQKQAALDEAMEYSERVLALAELRLERMPGDAGARRDLARALDAFAQVLFRSGEREQALDAYVRAIELGEVLVREFPATPLHAYDLAQALANAGAIAIGLDLDFAEESIERSLALQVELLAAAPESIDRLQGLGLAELQLGRMHHARGREQEALEAFDRALAQFRVQALHDPDPSRPAAMIRSVEQWRARVGAR